MSDLVFPLVLWFAAGLLSLVGLWLNQRQKRGKWEMIFFFSGFIVSLGGVISYGYLIMKGLGK